jgi:hypothetical protein
MDERVELAQRKGRRCMYCSGQRPVETITERLFLCCQKCADWDNNARVVKTTLPCICCGVELSPTWKEETITVNSVSHKPFDGGWRAAYRAAMDLPWIQTYI